MKKQTEYNQPQDSFSDYMKRRLEDHRMPIDAEGWGKLESRLQPQPKRPVWLVAALLVAAVSIGVLFVIIPDKAVQVEEQIAESMNTQPKELEKSASSSTLTECEKEETTKTSAKAPVLAIAPVATEISTFITSEEESDETITPEEKEDIIKDIQSEETPSQEPKEEVTDRRSLAPRDEKNQMNQYNPTASADYKSSRKRKVNSSWQIAAAIGSGNSVDMSINNDTYGDKQNESSNWFGNNGGESNNDWPSYVNHPNDFYDINCRLPLSFGLTVRKNLTNRLAVESGLVYTYLASSYKQRGLSGGHTDLELHYLGIPVNLVVNLWNHPLWNLYLSAGVMGEKGLKAVYTKKQNSGNFAQKTTDKESIDGMQWSLNGSVGIAYRVFGDWSLYVEPRVSYFFDNDQPLSSRTEHNFNIGIAGGIRFAF